VSLTERMLRAVGLQRFQPYTPEEIAAMWGSSLASGWFPQTTLNNKQEPIGSGFTSLVTHAYATNPVVFACVDARAQLFSEARFMFQRLEDGRPGELFNTPSTYLRLLEQPWPGGTTAMLLKDMLLDADLAGNAFVARRQNQLQRLRPDWVVIIAGSPNSNATTWDLDTEVLGYGYQPDGPSGGKEKVFLQRSEVAHFKTTHDPMRRFSGMPWLLPVLRDLSSDTAATSHKQKYFENAATPNLAIKFDPTMTLAAAKDWIELFNRDHAGARNAWKTLFLGGGADLTAVGNNLKDASFTDVQGKGELRIASAAGVPPIIIGLAGGLDAATYSNYGQARRAFADLRGRPMWRDACYSLATITSVPERARLWYDDTQISFLQEDVKDAADIGQAHAATIRTLTDAGFDPQTIVEAVVAGDFNRLKHTGLYSVQLQPPGTQTQPEPEPPPQQQPALLNAAGVTGEVRCSGCSKMLAEVASAPFRFTCPRCRQVTSSADTSPVRVEVKDHSADIAALRAEMAAMRATPAPIILPPPVEARDHSPEIAELRAEVAALRNTPAQISVPIVLPDNLTANLNVPAPVVNVTTPPAEVRVDLPPPPEVQSMRIVSMPKRTRTSTRKVKRDNVGVITETTDTSVEE
jgi:phage portal protein BeeE/phage FluMu protein Com